MSDVLKFNQPNVTDQDLRDLLAGELRSVRKALSGGDLSVDAWRNGFDYGWRTGMVIGLTFAVEAVQRLRRENLHPSMRTPKPPTPKPQLHYIGPEF